MTTTWSPDDLADRLCRALDLASEVVTDFGADGYVDSRVRELSFGPEKVIAEAAMLAYAASGSCDRPDVTTRVEAVARHLIPYARSSRALADTALQPVRAFKHAVPHVLLTSLGFADELYDDFFRARCALASGLAGDLPPSARLERHWAAGHWDGVWRPATDDQLRGTFADSPIDVLSDSREEAYSVTHLLFYLTDFGHEASPSLRRAPSIVLSELEGLLLRHLDREDYDLSGELLMAWPQLRAPWSPTATFAWRVLATVEDAVGVLPCGNVDLDHLGRLDAHERTRYARATAYHTAFVMGFLCAASLRHRPLPPTIIEGHEYPDAAWQALLEQIDADQGHWLDVLTQREDSEKRVLAPMLCNFAILQKLRQQNYAALRDVLLLASRFQLVEHPLRARATDVLMALGTAMTLSSGH
jgi:hypothetical protein